MSESSSKREKKKLAAAAACLFLDVEAEASNEEEEEEEEEEEQEAFIEDIFPRMNSTEVEIRPNNFRPNRRSDNEFNKLVESFVPERPQIPVRSDGKHSIPSYFERITVPGDVPLWRIKCRKNTEETALYSLMMTAQPHHELRSVFSKGRDHLYLEASMNLKLLNLLKKTPGLIQHSREMVPSNEYRVTLDIGDLPSDISVGSWVRIAKGKVHGGDVGMVVERRLSGAEVILIPRMPPPSEFVKTAKRKSTMDKYPQLLFNPQIYIEKFPSEVTLKGEGIYTLRKRRFEHGLERKIFKNTCLKRDPNEILYDNFYMFIACGHPSIDSSLIPRPQEWLFEVDEEVWIMSKEGRPGSIRQISSYSASVEIDYRDHIDMRYEVIPEIFDIPWKDIVKIVKVSDFVKFMTGPQKGECGWVLHIDAEDVVTVVGIEAQGSVSEHGQSYSAIESHRAHINTLRITMIPHHHASAINRDSSRLKVSSFVVVLRGQYVTRTGFIVKIEGEIATIVENMPRGGFHKAAEDECLVIPLIDLARTQHSQLEGDVKPLQDRPSKKNHPWLGLTVIVAKQHHPWKGLKGKIISVTPALEDIFDMKLQVRNINFNPAAQFEVVDLKYEDVRVDITHEMLNEYKPLNMKESRKPQIIETMTRTGTPLHTPQSHKIAPFWPLPPAWDPSSRTPLGSPYLSHRRPISMPPRQPIPESSSFSPAFVMSPFSSSSSPSPSYVMSPLSSSSLPAPSYIMSPISPFPVSSSSLPPGRSHLNLQSSSASPLHLLLNPSFIGTSFKVSIGGKEVMVSIENVGGRCSIRKKEQQQSVLVEPQQVTPKNPNPSRDNGLLVVIKGEHAGKFVRRIHHCTKTGQIILAVVTHTEGALDILTGEQFEVTADHLCIVAETTESKELNKDIMESLRAPHRGKKN